MPEDPHPDPHAAMKARLLQAIQDFHRLPKKPKPDFAAAHRRRRLKKPPLTPRVSSGDPAFLRPRIGEDR